MAWATVAQARTHWKVGTAVDTATLTDLLEAATEQCAEFAPTLAEGAPVPFRYMLATVYQARELYEAGTRNNDTIPGEGFVIRARPLTASIKQLLRPRTGKLTVL